MATGPYDLQLLRPPAEDKQEEEVLNFMLSRRAHVSSLYRFIVLMGSSVTPFFPRPAYYALQTTVSTNITRVL